MVPNLTFKLPTNSSASCCINKEVASSKFRPLHLRTLKKVQGCSNVPRHFLVHFHKQNKLQCNYSKLLKKNRKTIFGTDFHIIQPKPDNWIKVVKNREIDKKKRKDRANVYTKSHSERIFFLHYVWVHRRKNNKNSSNKKKMKAFQT